jgi:hypothetical protein
MVKSTEFSGNLQKSKKAQLKIQQMMFMLMAVIFLFVLVGIFFLSIRLYNLQKSANLLQEENSMLLVSKLANSPELSCGNAFGGSRANCVDFEKALILSYKKDYEDFWGGVAKIEIRKLYSDSSDVLCSKENYPDCGLLKVIDKSANVLPFSSNFVALCRKEAVEEFIYDKCGLAVLLVAAEDKSETG